MGDDLSRRQFMIRSAVYGGVLALAADWPRPRAARAAAASAAPVVLDPGQWACAQAITARILPSRADRPGALEAGCVNFIDKALAHEDARARPVYTQGLAATDAVSRARGGAPFAALPAAAQNAVLRDLEDGTASDWPDTSVGSSVFFATIRAHTLMGFLADPRYGGNRDYVGWKLTRYPGPAHHHGGYSPAQLRGEAPIRAVWGEDL